MEKVKILCLFDKKNFRRCSVKAESFGDWGVINAAKHRRALRKLKKLLNDETVIVNRFNTEEKILENKLREYDELSYKTVLPVMGKLLRQVSEKYASAIPFRNVYIVAEPSVAYEIILEIPELSRMFSVVTELSPEKQADDIYFEYGCIIRHIKRIPRILREDDVLILTGKNPVCEAGPAIVVDMGTNNRCGNKKINMNEIYVYDERISCIQELWGGKCGLMLFQLMGILPDNSTNIDINKSADRIFLLDIEKI